MNSAHAILASTPEPPYYAVIFSSLRTAVDAGYDATAIRMAELAAASDGYLGADSARGSDGVGITVSYWRDLESIRAWKANGEHREAQRRGHADWYSAFQVRIAKVERAYGAGGKA
ncbi:MAG TPA: antibiotic biosynthesis monooxygenase [Opitutaceae bacterium]